MRFKSVIALLGLVLTGCVHDNARLSRQIVGAWSLDVPFNPASFAWNDPVLRTWTISSDGSFEQRLGHASRLVTYQGTWSVAGEQLRLTFTNAFGVENNKPALVAGTVHQCKIMKVDAHTLVILGQNGSTNTFRLLRL
jgi:hypothetical protein